MPNSHKDRTDDDHLRAIMNEIFLDGVKYILAADAGKHAGLTRDYVTRLCRAGMVAGKQVGKNWYVDPQALESFHAEKERAQLLRSEELAHQLAREYRAAHGPPVLPTGKAGGRHGLSSIVATAEIPARAEARTRSSELLPAISPVAFARKLTALAVVALLAVGTYAMVETGPAHFARETIQNAALATVSGPPSSEPSASPSSGAGTAYYLSKAGEGISTGISSAISSASENLSLAGEALARDIRDNIISTAESIKTETTELISQTKNTILAEAESIARTTTALATATRDTAVKFKNEADRFVIDTCRRYVASAVALATATRNTVVALRNDYIAAARALASSLTPLSDLATSSLFVQERSDWPQTTVPLGGYKLPATDSSFAAATLALPHFSLTTDIFSTSRNPVFHTFTHATARPVFASNPVREPAASNGAGNRAQAGTASTKPKLAAATPVQTPPVTLTHPIREPSASNGAGTIPAAAPQVLPTLPTGQAGGRQATTLASLFNDLLSIRLQQLENKLTSQMFSLSAANSTVTAQNYAVTAQTNKIDQLNSVAISNSTFSGGSISGTAVTASTLSTGDLSAGNTTLGSTTVTANLTVDGSLALSGTSASISAAYATITNATTTNFYAVLGHFTTGVIDTLTSTLATITNLTATELVATNGTTTNGSIASLVTTSATSTNFYATTLGAVTASTTNLTFQTAVGGNATTTNLFSTTASSTNLYSTSAAFGVLSANSAVVASATTTNLFSTTASSTNLFSTNGNIGILTAGTLSLTAGTTTDFFSTTASSTNLFSQLATLGALIANSLTVNGTFTQTGLATFTSGFLSNASSTITSGLFSMNGGASTTNITASGIGYFTTATTTNLFSTNFNLGTGTLGNATTTNLFSSIASSTNLFSTNANLGTVTAGTLSLTAGTTTNFFSTTASSTNLFSQLATLGAITANTLTLNSTLSAGTSTLTNLIVSNTSTSTFAGYIDVNGTSGTSTIASNLWVKGTLRTGTGSLYLNDTSLAAGNGGFALNTSATSTFATNGFTVGTSHFVVQQGSGNIGIATTSPSTTFGVVGHCVTGDTRLRRRRRRSDGSYEEDEVAIKDVKEGDEIQSLDEKTGELVWSRVNALLDMGVKQTYRIITEDGRSIRTTAEHPYLVKNAKGKWLRHRSAIKGAGWASVSQLKEGDEIAVRATTNNQDYLPSRIRVTSGMTRRLLRSRITSESAYRMEVSSSIWPNFSSRSSGSFCGIRSHTTPNTSPLHIFAKSMSFVTTMRFSASEMLASVLSPLAFFATAKLISRSERRVASSMRTFSSSRNRISVDDDIVVSGERACVAQGSSNLLTRERSHESIFNVLNTFSGRKHFHNLPDHDARAFERGLAVANLGVSDDVLIDGDSFVHNADSVARGQVKSQWRENNNAEKGMKWAKIRSVEPVAEEQVYDIEVEGTHNFIGNDIVAHNTYLTGGLGVGVLNTTNGTLQTSGNATVGGVAAFNGTSGTTTIASGQGFTVGSSQLVVQQGSGNVGIGTTAPGSPLHVYSPTAAGQTLLTLHSAMDTAGQYVDLLVDQKTSGRATGIRSQLEAGAYDSSLRFMTQTAQNSLVTQMTIQHDGNVGIGTTTPVVKLDVIGTAGSGGDATYPGTIKITDFNLGGPQATGGLEFKYHNSNSGYGAKLYTSATNDTFGIATRFNSATWTERLVINASSGNVGLGTTTPDRKLDVYGGDVATNEYLRIKSWDGTYGTGDAQIWYDGVGGLGSATGFLAFGTNVDNQMVLQDGGNVGIGTTGPGEKLDVNGNIQVADSKYLKFNITDLTNAAPVWLYGDAYSVSLTTNTYGSTGVSYTVPVNTAIASWKTFFGGSATLAHDFWKISRAPATAGTPSWSDLFTVLATGNVGIGTTTPLSKLAVSGGLSVGADYNIAAPTNGAIIQGNVGIGDSSPAATALLNIGSITTGATDAYGILLDGSIIPGTASKNVYGINVSPSLYEQSSGTQPLMTGVYVAPTFVDNAGSVTTLANGINIATFAAAAGTVTATGISVAAPTAATNNYAAIFTGGNVGIGTTNPLSKLNIEGANYASGGAYNTYGNLFISSSDAEAINMGGSLTFGGVYSGATRYSYAGIFGKKETSGVGSALGYLSFATDDNTNLVERMRITSGGNVGIGTTGPENILHVAKSNAGGIGGSLYLDNNGASTLANETQIAFVNDVGGSFAGVAGARLRSITTAADTGAGSFQIDTWNGAAEVTRVFIKSDGNVGIGTTTPDRKLDVYGGDVATNEYLRIKSWDGTYGTGDAQIWYDGVGGLGSATGFLAFGTNVDSQMVLQDGGNVGIGTTSPSTKLHLHGAAGSPVKLTISEGGAESAITTTRNTDSNGDLRFQTEQAGDGVATRMIIDYSGNVGIGTTNPLNLLDIAGKGGLSINVGDISFSNNLYITGGNIKRETTLAGSSVYLTAGEVIFYTQAAGGAIGDTVTPTQTMKVSANGTMTVNGPGTTCTIGSGTGATNCTSDSRLKTNITDIGGADALAGLAKIHGVTFNWADPSRLQNQRVGIIAQDVLNAFPQVVDTATTTFNGVSGSYYTVDYAALVSPLIAAVNELNSRTNFISNSATSTALFVDVAGNVGIGTSTPQHRLQVAGDVAAEAFVNSSTRELKTDITGLATTTEDSILEQLATTNVYSYRYKDEAVTNPLRIGLIVDSAPDEVLSVNSDGVDIYKLAVFTLAGVKAQSRQIEALNLNLESIISSAATSTPESQSFATSFFSNIFTRITAWLADAANGVGDFFAGKIHTKEICVQKSDGSEFCANGDQLAAMAAGAAGSTSDSTGAGGNTSEGGVTSGTTSSASSTPAVPTISINGNNPSTITVGDTFGDLGAIITGPTTADTNLGIHVFQSTVDSEQLTEVQNVQIDTSVAGTYTIAYVATNSAGTATSTRTVIIEALASTVVAEEATTTTDTPLESGEPLTGQAATTTDSTI